VWLPALRVQSWYSHIGAGFDILFDAQKAQLREKCVSTLVIMDHLQRQRDRFSELYGMVSHAGPAEFGAELFCS
jgi:hypothetical protein